MCITRILCCKVVLWIDGSLTHWHVAHHCSLQWTLKYKVLRRFLFAVSEQFTVDGVAWHATCVPNLKLSNIIPKKMVAEILCAYVDHEPTGRYPETSSSSKHSNFMKLSTHGSPGHFERSATLERATNTHRSAVINFILYIKLFLNKLVSYK